MSLTGLSPEALRALLDIPGDPASTRVVIAMSGGVDSSVAAALVAEAGYDAVGITLQLYDLGALARRKGACCAGQDIYDARAVADRLGIAHYVLDYENHFKEQVMADFADAYARGETPIPCVRCNERVKFADLMRTARELGARALVTGHYVQRVRGSIGAELHRAKDHNRDQSYFLFATTRTQLEFLRFPLGGWPKADTRAVAKRLGLAVAAKPDSQDICFVPDGDYAEVVTRLRPDAAAPGDIVHTDRRVLGRHKGVIHYTIGQRKGLELGHHEALFVVALDAASARVIVGPREALAARDFSVREINWIGEGPLSREPVAVAVKVRSMKPPVPAEVSMTGAGEAKVTLFSPQEAIAPGQAAVFYDAHDMSRVLGGGWIARAKTASRAGEPARLDAVLTPP
jgi:tRNA-specific 2-thiouridylase